MNKPEYPDDFHKALTYKVAKQDAEAMAIASLELCERLEKHCRELEFEASEFFRHHQPTAGNKRAQIAADIRSIIISAPGEKALVLAKNQPCGCVICTCDNEKQCMGCGSRNCGQHAFGDLPEKAYEKETNNT